MSHKQELTMKRPKRRLKGRNQMHVDIVKNEWLAGYQVVVARLHEDRGRLRIDAQAPWDGLIERARQEPWAESDRAFARSLHEHLVGDYLFATPPHDESDCPFGAMVAPMAARPIDESRAAQQAVH